VSDRRIGIPHIHRFVNDKWQKKLTNSTAKMPKKWLYFAKNAKSSRFLAEIGLFEILSKIIDETEIGG
jgi:hypothetical protein